MESGGSIQDHGIDADYVAWHLLERDQIVARKFGMKKIAIDRRTYYMFRHLCRPMTGLGLTVSGEEQVT